MNVKTRTSGISCQASVSRWRASSVETSCSPQGAMVITMKPLLGACTPQPGTRNSAR